MKIIQRKKNPKNKKIIEERQKINTKSEKRSIRFAAINKPRGEL